MLIPKTLAGLVLLALSLVWGPGAMAQTGWKDANREHYGFVIEVDGEVVGALAGQDWMHRKNRKEMSFARVFVYSEGFQAWLTARGGTKDLVVKRTSVTEGEEATVVLLGGCMVMESEPVELEEDAEHPSALRAVTDIKVGYTQIEMVP